jgi:fluoride exporter
MTWLAVGLGGALGSMARHGVNLLLARLLGDPIPYATAAVNIVGCFIIGVLAGAVAASQIVLSDTQRLFIFVGVLGGFTTFSSFGLDTLVLMRHGHAGLALANVAGQLTVAVVSVFGGYYVIAGR